ncbi:MAG: GatB/YqeY domain-containing protein [Patescibacteria group bacterium]
MTQQEIKAEIIVAMKAKDAVKLSVMRALSAAITNDLVSKERGPDGQLTEDEVMTLISRSAKQHKDSIDQFRAGGREDLVATEQAELDILTSLLPAQMSREEIVALITSKIAEQGITADQKNQFMGGLMKELKGKADGSVVKEVVDAAFA